MLHHLHIHMYMTTSGVCISVQRSYSVKIRTRHMLQYFLILLHYSRYDYFRSKILRRYQLNIQLEEWSDMSSKKIFTSKLIQNGARLYVRNANNDRVIYINGR